MHISRGSSSPPSLREATKVDPTDYGITYLGPRPRTLNHLNGGSFQQDAIITFKGWQYVVIYLDGLVGARHVHLLRRKLPLGSWQVIEFNDYHQKLDDGHNVCCIGISPSDGRIHISWDLHNSTFNYRISRKGLADDPEGLVWTREQFSSVQHGLPGVSKSSLEEVTYPRFLPLGPGPSGRLLLELRTGMAGLGDCRLFVYEGEGRWRDGGIYLKGVGNNPYINGLDLDTSSTLHVSWCYRAYVPISPDQLRQTAQQAGPNGPENNYDLYYAYSPAEDGVPGRRWYNRNGLSVGESPIGVEPNDEPEGPRVFAIPKGTGIINQEGQCVGRDGSIHVLNREISDGRATWFHYIIGKNGAPSKVPLRFLPESSTSSRGKISYYCGRLLAMLPIDLDIVVIDLETEEELIRVIGAGVSGHEVLFDLSMFVCLKESLAVVDVVVPMQR